MQKFGKLNAGAAIKTLSSTCLLIFIISRTFRQKPAPFILLIGA